MPSRRAHNIGWRQFAVLLVALLLAACNEGGRPYREPIQPTSITSGTSSVRFALQHNSGPVTQDVNLVFTGTDVLVGFPPDVTPPLWLTVTPGPVTGNTARYTLTVEPFTQAPGHYSTTVRFRTGNIPAGGTEDDIKVVSEVDVPVELEVVDLDVAQQLISTDLIKGSNIIYGALDILSASDLVWTASSNQPWLTLDASGGTGSASLGYAVDPLVAGNGAHLGTATILHPESGVSVATSFAINVVSPDLLLNPTALTFNVDAGTPPAQYSQSLIVSDRISGSNAQLAVSWSVASINVPWLSMTPTSGSSAPAVTATVSVRADQLGGLANGTHTGTITLAYTTEDGVAHTRAVPVTLNLAL